VQCSAVYAEMRAAPLTRSRFWGVGRGTPPPLAHARDGVHRSAWRADAGHAGPAEGKRARAV